MADSEKFKLKRRKLRHVFIIISKKKKEKYFSDVKVFILFV